MPKDLFLPMTSTHGDDTALSAAIALASRFDAHLTVLEMVNLSVSATIPWRLIPEQTLLSLHDDLREAGKRNAARLRTQLEKENISWEVRLTEVKSGDPARFASLQAQCSDVAIVTAPNGSDQDSDIVRRFFGALLFETGRPVMVVPARRVGQPPIRHAVVAWRPAREAARAVHDALPFLAQAASVDVVRVAVKGDDSTHGTDSDLDMAAHLARHGLKVKPVYLQQLGGSVATALLKHAADSGAQLLVAGGYGHSRVREWLFGGATRELLHSTPLPVLFSH